MHIYLMLISDALALSTYDKTKFHAGRAIYIYIYNPTLYLLVVIVIVRLSYKKQQGTT